MATDAKGILKDNSKLILSVIGICVLAALMSTVSFTDNGLFGVWDLSDVTTDEIEDTGNNRFNPLSPGGMDNNNGSSGTATPLNNGKNDTYGSAPINRLQAGSDYQVDIVTNMGTIKVDLLEDASPINVNNFVFLAQEGFYVGTSFHRVVSEFIVQGGDPLGTGAGGPGYEIPDEINRSVRFRPYSVAMANSGANRNGSQFFIVSKDAPTSALASLDGKYTIIGDVINGFNVVDNIDEVDVDSSYMPIRQVVIQDVRVVAR